MIPSPFDEPAVCILETKLCSTAVSSGRLLSGPAVCAALLHELVGLSDRVSRGTLVSASVHPREVFKAAVLANAAALVVGHNHPSGDPRESAEDRAMVQRLRDAGSLLGIEVLDSIIVTPQGVYFSASDGCTGQLNRTQVPEVADGP